MIGALAIALVVIVVLAIIIVLLPRLASKETCTYDEAVNKFATGKFVTVDGKKVHYVEKGSGKPVILIHGFLYHTVAWRQNIDALARNFKTYAIDLFGWGYSDRLRTTDYSFPVYDQQIIGFMDGLGIDKAFLVGHSMGGGVAVHVAAHHPDRVDKLILIDPGVLPISMTTIGWIYQRPFIGEFLNAIPGNALWENNIKTIWFYDSNKVTKEYVGEVMRPLCIEGSHAGLMYILRHVLKPPYVENEAKALAKLDKPILILHGREDKAVPMDKSESLNRMWKGSKLVVFEKTGHNPHEEHSEEFNKLAVEFLSQ